MLCNVLTQSHFDHSYLAWYPNLDEKLKRRIHIAQDKCIRFYFKLEQRHQISRKEFQLINWLPVYNRVHQCMNTTSFKFVNNALPLLLE